jgi:hypothetical protein
MIPRHRRTLGLALAGLAAAVALLGTVAPLALGGAVREAYGDLLHATLDKLPVGTLVLEQYDRGWLGSSAVAELALQPMPVPVSGRPPVLRRIRLDSRIEQGPLVWLSSMPSPVLARVYTRVEWPDTPLPPLGIETDLYPSGDALSRLRLPAGDRVAGRGAYRLRNGEAAGTIRYTAKSGRLNVDLALPDLELATIPPAGLPGSTGSGVPLGSLAGARISADLSSWVGGLYAGTASLEVRSARLAGTSDPDGPGSAAASAETRLDGFRARLDQSPRQGLLDLRLDLATDSLAVGGAGYRDARIALSAQSLDGAALAELISALRTLKANGATPAIRGLAGAAMVTRLLPQLAAASPRIDLDPVRIETLQGAVTGRLNLGIEKPPDQSKGPFAWIRALGGQADLALPRSTALDWLARGAARTQESAEQRLARLSADGWIGERDGRVGADWRLADGLLTLNGRTLPLTALAGR